MEQQVTLTTQNIKIQLANKDMICATNLAKIGVKVATDPQEVCPSGSYGTNQVYEQV